ncbi:hypothetical protein [Phosphitispora sp. TUW77]|uniref:hypothetical protein n=1 Tax=Phosphitispora sp. TUW77 TaxID=3152361 RepID=UPI003AB5A8A1
MAKETNQLNEEEKEALKFLERDFNQSYQQMRHYDQQIFEIFKFLFTAYTALVGVSVGLFQFGLKEGIDLRLAGVSAIAVAIVLGLFLLGVAVRNRIYFVQVTRYINEQRRLFVVYKPLGFQNCSGMYTDPKLPPYFDWRSSQSWITYTVATLNSILFGVFLYLYLPSNPYRKFYIIISGSILLVIQLFVCIRYLMTREKKNADGAVFGRKC